MKCKCIDYVECEDCPCYYDCNDIYEFYVEVDNDELMLMTNVFNILF